MANKILIFTKLSSDGTVDGYFALKLIDIGGGFFRLRALDQADSDYPSLASNIPDTGDQLAAATTAIDIGDPVNGGTPNAVLFVDAAGLLADDAQFLYDPASNELTITDIILLGGIAFPNDQRQVFNPGASAAGLNVGSVAVDPSALFDGDIWYDSALNILRARINGASRTLGAGLAIGDTITGATAGSVFFAGAAGILAQDNTNLFFDDALNQLQLAAGDVANPSLRIGPTPGNGLLTTGNNLIVTTAGAESMQIFAGAFSLGVSRDIGMARNAAGVIRVSDGSTGIAALLTSRLITVDADGRAVAATESLAVFTNEGAAALDVFTLPTAVAGLQYTFVVQDADGIQVQAAAGDTIRIAGAVSSVAGTATSTTIGDTLTLVAINATEWVAIGLEGTGWVLA